MAAVSTMEPPSWGSRSRTARRAASSSADAAVKLLVPTPTAGSISLVEGIGLRIRGRDWMLAPAAPPKAHAAPAAIPASMTARRDSLRPRWQGDLTGLTSNYVHLTFWRSESLLSAP